jgi:hypothetical protein
MNFMPTFRRRTRNHRSSHSRAHRQRLVATILLAVVAGAGIFLVAHAASPAGSPGPDRLHRQVGVMEGIIDKVLLDSPNFLVGGRESTGGLVLPDYGVVFSFNTSLNDTGLRFGDLSPLGLAFDFNTSDDGTFIVRKRSRSTVDKSTDADKEALDQAKMELDRAKEERDQTQEESAQIRKEVERVKKEGARVRDKVHNKLSEWETQHAETSQKLYADGKQELVQMLLDYGETLAELKDGQWVVLAGFFDRNNFLRDRKVSRLVLRAKIDDLRAYSTGRLTESAARDRVIIEEY